MPGIADDVSHVIIEARDLYMQDCNHGGVEFSGLSLIAVVAVSKLGRIFSVTRCAIEAFRILPQELIDSSET